MISRDEMVDRLLKCARRDASDARDPVSRSRRQKRLEQTGRTPQFSLVVLFGAQSAAPLPAPLGWTACSGSAFLRRTAPALVRASPIGRKMTHTLIWRQARTKRFVTIFGAKSTPPGIWNSAHVHMPANARRMPRAECCCCCWGKNPIHKITAQHTYT